MGSDQRTATYTTLPVGTYAFEVQGATARGPWSEPGAKLRIEILPAWYQTLWFRSLCVAVFLLLLSAAYILRLKQLHHQFHRPLKRESMSGRGSRANCTIRCCRASMVSCCGSRRYRIYCLNGPRKPSKGLRARLSKHRRPSLKAEMPCHELRSATLTTVDLGQAIGNFGKELLGGSFSGPRPDFVLQVEGKPRPLNPIVRDEVYRHRNRGPPQRCASRKGSTVSRSKFITAA